MEPNVVVLWSQVALFLLLWLSPSPASAFSSIDTSIRAAANHGHTGTCLRFWSASASLSFSASRQLSSSPLLSARRAGDTNDNSATASAAMPTTTPLWFQHAITVTAPSRGCHLITGDILKATGSDLKTIEIGLCNLFIQHTSASLTINENADADVRTDMETALNRLVPATWNRDGTFRHTAEGDDVMPGHVKSSLMGVSLTIPIRHGKLALGTWQGIYLNEHRDQGGWGGGHQRNIIVTLQGVGK
jgi:secondary thiamine-phosphate synthase enzyme